MDDIEKEFWLALHVPCLLVDVLLERAQLFKKIGSEPDSNHWLDNCESTCSTNFQNGGSNGGSGG